MAVAPVDLLTWGLVNIPGPKWPWGHGQLVPFRGNRRLLGGFRQWSSSVPCLSCARAWYTYPGMACRHAYLVCVDLDGDGMNYTAGDSGVVAYVSGAWPEVEIYS